MTVIFKEHLPGMKVFFQGSSRSWLGVSALAHPLFEMFSTSLFDPVNSNVTFHFLEDVSLAS